MSHNIEAIIIADDADFSILSSVKDVHRMPLSQGLILIPVTDELSDGQSEGEPDGSENPYEQFWKFSKGIQKLIERLSKGRPVAYVETEYFGGTGAQVAAVWKDGSLEFGPEQAEIGPINAALRLLGVHTEKGRDEFDSVGLGRFRSNEDWIEQPRFRQNR